MLAVIPIVDALVSLDFRIFANKKTPLNYFNGKIVDACIIYQIFF